MGCVGVGCVYEVCGLHEEVGVGIRKYNTLPKMYLLLVHTSTILSPPLEACFWTKFGTFWKPSSTKYGTFWHANLGVDPKLAETAPLFYRVTDVPLLPKMEEPKLVQTIFYELCHISD